MDSKHLHREFWGEENLKLLRDVISVIYKKKSSAGASAENNESNGVVRLNAIYDKVRYFDKLTPANTWGSVINTLIAGGAINPIKASCLLLACAKLTASEDKVRDALAPGNLGKDLVHLAAKHQRSIGGMGPAGQPALGSKAPVRQGGLLDIFDRSLEFPDKWLSNWLFGSGQTAEPAYFSTYRLSARAGMVARSLTAFHPPRSGESFVRFTNWLRINAQEATPDPLRTALGVVMPFGRSLVMLGNIKGAGAKLISLERPDSDDVHPYFSGLVQTFSKKTIIGARILLVRRLTVPEKSQDFVHTFPCLATMAQAQESFAEEIGALEASGQLDPGVLRVARLPTYLSNELGGAPVLSPHSDSPTASL